MAMDQSAAKGRRQTQATTNESQAIARSVVSQICSDNLQLALSQAYSQGPSHAHESHGDANGMDLCTATGAHEFQKSHVDAAAADGLLDQEVQHDEPKLAAESVRPLDVASLLELLKQQDFRCALSGRRLTPANIVLDHIAPFSESNCHTIDNVQLVVQEANKAKGCMKNQDFIALCCDIAAWNEGGSRLPGPGKQ